jgi:hypothetical protein
MPYINFELRIEAVQQVYCRVAPEYCSLTLADCCSNPFLQSGALELVCCPAILQAMYSNGSNTLYQEESLTYFSSRGPPSDMRVKPDLVRAQPRVLTLKGVERSIAPGCTRLLRDVRAIGRRCYRRVNGSYERHLEPGVR